MKNFFGRYNRQDGFSTVMAVFVVAVASLAIAGLMPMLSQAMKTNVHNKEHLQALYAAQAGIKRVQAEFEHNSNAENAFDDWRKREIFMDGSKQITYTVDYAQAPEEQENGRKVYYFKSVGKVKSVFGSFGAAEKVIDNVEIIVKSSSQESDAFDKYTLYSAGNMHLSGGRAYVAGDAATLGNSISNSQWNHINVNGQYYALEEHERNMHLDGVQKSQIVFAPKLSSFQIDLDENPVWPVAGYDGIPDGTEPMRLPVSGQIAGYYKESAGVNCYNRNYTLTGDTVLQVDGNVNMNNLASFQGEDYGLTLIVKGKMEMSNHSKIKVKHLKVYAKGGIHYANSSAVEAETVLLQTEGDFHLTNESAVNPTLFDTNVDDIAKTKVELYGKNMYFDSQVQVNGANVKIHAKELFQTSNTFAINKDLAGLISQTSGDVLQVKAGIYSDGEFDARNGWIVNAHDCLMQSKGKMSLNGQMQINGRIDGKTMKNSITRIQSHGEIALVGGPLSIASGTAESNNAGVITADEKVNVQNHIDAPNVLLIADDTITLNGQTWFAGIYTNGDLDMAWVTDCHINENHVKDHLMNLLGNKGYLPKFSGLDGGAAGGSAGVEIIWPSSGGIKS